MTFNIIKFFFVFYFTAYICLSIINKAITSKQIFLCACLGLISSLLITLLDMHTPEIKFICPLFVLWVSLSIITSKPQITFVSTIISFGISYSVYALSSLLFVIITYTLSGYLFSYEAFALVSGLFQTASLSALFQIRRFRNGMKFLTKTSTLNLATILCLIFIIVLTHAKLHKLFEIAIIAFVSALAFLIYWWQAQITKAYRHQLELRATESLRAENARLLLENRKLTEDKDRMAYISHRDNTLITTLKNATLSYLYTDYSNPEEALKARDELVANIEALSAGRTSIPDNYNEKQARTFDTNFTLLNKLLHQMDADAIQQNITFSVHFGVMLDEFVPRDISEIDLVHTVDDLLKNAFKATRNSEPRMVQLQFYKLGKFFVVEVADNGIPFEVKSLVNMGIEKLTTYEDGSGIGLVDIWSTKEKYGATYHLEEYVTPSPFSKKISLTFDKKNRYSIRTWRKDEILQMSKRADLQVYEHME